MWKVDEHDERIKQERDKHEFQLNREKDQFLIDIETFIKEVDTLKEFGGRYLYKDMNTKIDALNDKLQEMLKTRTRIIEDYDILGNQTTETFPRLTDG